MNRQITLFVIFFLSGYNFLIADTITQWRDALSTTIDKTAHYRFSPEYRKKANDIFSNKIISDQDAEKLFVSDTVTVVYLFDIVNNDEEISILSRDCGYTISNYWGSTDKDKNEKNGYDNLELEFIIKPLSISKRKIHYNPSPYSLDYLSLLYLYLDIWRIPIPEYILTELKRLGFAEDSYIDAFRVIRMENGDFTVDRFNYSTIRTVGDPVNLAELPSDNKMTESQKKELIEIFEKLYSPNSIPQHIMEVLEREYQRLRNQHL